jgi:hypothetical protein
MTAEMTKKKIKDGPVKPDMASWSVMLMNRKYVGCFQFSRMYTKNTRKFIMIELIPTSKFKKANMMSNVKSEAISDPVVPLSIVLLMMFLLKLLI